MADEISSSDTEKEKLRLIRLITEELRIHGLVDVTGYVDDHTIIIKSHTHSGFVRSLAFKIEKMGIGEVIPVEDWKRFYVKELTWDKRHPFLHAMRINFANSFLYVIAGLLVAVIGNKLTKSKLEDRLENQKLEIQNLKDSLARIQTRIGKIEKTKEDTNKSTK